ncbi:MAG: ribosome recycling factor [Bacteroidota bacterium]
MDPDIQQILKDTEGLMKKAVDHLQNELTKIRAGKASPAMIDGVKVDYYGSLTPISQVGNVSASDARTLTVQPWEKSLLAPIEKAIRDANLGLNPSNDGNMVRIPIPALTEERRKDLVKQANAEGESCRISMRNTRNDSNKKLKGLLKENASEDAVKGGEIDIQEMTDKYGKQVDAILKEKEAQIMTV